MANVYKISDEGVKDLQNLINYVEKMAFVIDDNGDFTGILIEYRDRITFSHPAAYNYKTKMIK